MVMAGASFPGWPAVVRPVAANDMEKKMIADKHVAFFIWATSECFGD